MDHFQIRTSYKGMAGIVDNLSKFRGYFDKDSSNGSLWKGATLKPLKKFENNFQVVSTDYDQYAILYTCTHLTAMYDKDSITVLVRQAPGVEEPSEELMETIRSEFDRIFGDPKAKKEGEEESGDEKKDKKDEEFLKEDEEKESGAEDKKDKKESPEDKEKEAGAEEKDAADKEKDAAKDEKDAGAEKEDAEADAAKDEKDAGAEEKDAAEAEKDSGAEEKDADAAEDEKDAGVEEQEKPDPEEEGAGNQYKAARM